MTTPRNIKIALMALVLAFALGTLRQADAQQTTPAKLNCATATEAEIVKAIYQKIAVKYAKERAHINVTFKAGLVTLRGWATTAAAKKEIEKLAKKDNCGKKFVSNLKVGASMGCGPGQKKCGDICIPEEDTCNILNEFLPQQ